VSLNYREAVARDSAPQRPIDAKRQQKQANRASMVSAAAELFATTGFAGTTMESVARASGMSVQSVYFVFHTKANLLQSALDAAASPRPRVAEQDPDRALVLFVDHASHELAATAALALAAAAAAPGDAAAREVHGRYEADRARAAASLVHQLRNRRPLAPGVTARKVSDVVFGLLSPQLYSLLVHDRGWSRQRYAAWSADAIGRALWD
jgi:AcrR family transcriptional regulator